MILASRLALSASLAYFLLANLLGLLIGSGAVSLAWRPAHAHLNLLGFVSMMIYGVAYHALPRFAGVPFRRPRLAVAQVGLANLGLAGMALSWGLHWPASVFALWGTLQFVASVLFVVLLGEVLWSRRPKMAVKGAAR